MAKITLSTLTSAFSSITKLNANFTLLQTHLRDKVLYRNNPTGEANQMENDLDMNANDIQNVGTLEVTALSLGGTTILPSTALAEAVAQSVNGEVIIDGTLDGAALIANTVNGNVIEDNTLDGASLQAGTVPYTALTDEVMFFETTGGNTSIAPFAVTNTDFDPASVPLITQGTKIFEKTVAYGAGREYSFVGSVPVKISDTGRVTIVAFIESGDGTQNTVLGVWNFQPYDSGASVSPWTSIPITCGAAVLAGTGTPGLPNKFSLRCSVTSGDTAYINQNAGGDNFGGKMYTWVLAFGYKVTA